MTHPPLPAHRHEDARAKALAAAVRCFSAKPYEHVGLRDIAAEAGLDVARVHRLFGSKARLFAESVRQAFAGWPGTSAANGLADVLARHLLSADGGRDGDPLLLLVRSASDPQAAPILREQLETSLLRPAAESLRTNHGPSDANPRDAERSAALLAACCLGIAMLRDVMGVPALAGTADAALAARVERLLSDCLSPIDEASRAPALLEPLAHSG